MLFYIFSIFLGGGGNLGLDEVVLHEALEVEVGELVLLGKLKELGELGIRVNLAAIGGVLKLVGLDVGVELLAHVSASHLSSNGLAKEGSKLVADAGGLHEARGLAVDVVAALLGGGLLGRLHLTGNGLLKGLEIVLEGGEEANKLLELGAVLGHLDRETREGSIGSNLGDGGCRSSGNLRSGRLGGRSCDLLGAGGLGGRSLNLGGSRNRGGGGSSGLRSSNHSGYYRIYNNLSFKSFNKQINKLKCLTRRLVINNSN